MRTFVVLAAVLFSVMPTATAHHPCPEVAPGVHGCDNNGDGEVDQYGAHVEGEGYRANADVARVRFGDITLNYVGGDAHADTPAGPVDAFAYSYCFDFDDDPTTCDPSSTVGYATFDSDQVDAGLTAIYLDWDELSLGQHTLVADAAGTRSYALVYHYCHQDATQLDGCLAQIVIVQFDAAGAADGWAVYGSDGASTSACAVVWPVTGACQAVPVSA